MQLAQDISSQLPGVVKQVALPALLAGAGTGALSAYMSSRGRPHGENPKQRRHRILRNSLVGTLLGGTAGAALPLGLKMVGEPFFGTPQGLSPGKRLIGAGIDNALPVGAGAAGGIYLGRLRGQERASAMSQILDRVRGSNVNRAPIKNEAVLRNLLETGKRDEVLRLLAGKGKGRSVDSLLKSHELLSEAGYRGQIMDKMRAAPRFGGFWGTHKPTGDMTQAIRDYIARQSSLPGPLKRFGLSNLAAQSVGRNVGGRSLTPVAEAYLNYLRPGAKRMIGRSGWLGRLGLLGAGVYGAKELQGAILGR